ncbi:hypothetical protein SEA_ODAY_61 [Gordonia phage ODay]|nr:hypothetical protein SEA_ODAY_61 [Gordonia phage ODay]
MTEFARGGRVESTTSPFPRDPALCTYTLPAHTTERGRNIVAALTATFTPRFTDHSRPTTCGCAERGSGTSHPQAVAQAPDVEEASGAPKPTQQ